MFLLSVFDETQIFLLPAGQNRHRKSRKSNKLQEFLHTGYNRDLYAIYWISGICDADFAQQGGGNFGFHQKRSRGTSVEHLYSVQTEYYGLGVR